MPPSEPSRSCRASTSRRSPRTGCREALLWNFTVLGEAAGQIDLAVRDRFPHISWQQPTRLRNRVVHGYWSIDLEIIHTTATELLPPFIAQLRQAQATLEAEPDRD